MDLHEFRATLDQAAPPAGLNPLLQALWYDAKGEWDAAHAMTQEIGGTAAACVHAYLHRHEGDRFNAGYWYAKAGKQMPVCSLQVEWENLARALLA